MIQVSAGPVHDFAALGERWRALEHRASPSFFQSWTWVGCLVDERFPDPVLVEATEDGRTVALALFNRAGGAMHLGETGDHDHDCPYVEWNGVLCATGREAELTRRCLQAVSGRVVLSGIDAGTLEAVRDVAGLVRVIRMQPAPFAALDRSRDNADYLGRRSANTRQQLRRSDRAFATAGPLAVTRADSPAAARVMLDGLAALHQASWIARGAPGSFANPFFRRFHDALIGIGLPRGEIDLLRVAAGERIVGILYNFRYRGHALAYQSGFDYRGDDNRRKPGLTCHHQAIRFALETGLTRYDFLAGDDRYKRSLADDAVPLYWVESGNRLSPRLLFRTWRDRLNRRPAL